MTTKPLTDQELKQHVLENLQNAADNDAIDDLLAMDDEAAAVDMIFGTDDFETTSDVDEEVETILVQKVAAAIREYRPLFEKGGNA